MNEHNSVRILIAEDSSTQAEQLRFLLEQHGYQVTVAADGKQALQAAVAEKPALVISDIVMPEMNGYELCKTIKSDEILKDIPVILVTSLADPQDVILGLECGADNFIRKPYDGDYLASRIHYLLINLKLRKGQKMQLGVEIDLNGCKHFITAERQQILDLLISTYEQAIQINEKIKEREKELAHSNQVLNGLYRIAESLNQGGTEREVAELALERALELPGVQSGWIWLLEGESSYRIVATRNLSLSLDAPGALEDECLFQRQLLSGELNRLTNIQECERFNKAKDVTHELRYHASIPLWQGNRTLGVMNLAGSEEWLFNEKALEVLYGVGNQVAVALERARLHEHLEILVKQRTAALTEEIAERKRVEQALRENEEQLAVIINSTMDAVISVDEQQQIRLFNPAAVQMFGLSAAEAIGQPLSRLIPERFHRAHEGHIRNFSHTGITARHMGGLGEISGLRTNGEEFPIEASISQSAIAGGKLFTAILRDITERKQAENEICRLNVDLEQRVAERTTELTAANQELDSFAYAVAHDLRAPLRAMNGFSQALREDYSGQLQGEAMVYLEQIGLASRKMSDLIDGLLTLSRSTRGGLQYEVVDISALSKRLLVELAQSDPERQVTVEVEAGLQARGDARMIEVMMRNLLGNAWKYTTHVKEPSIRVYAEERDNARLFCVADNGAGFDMTHANRLFKPFQRLHRQEEFPGIGIGLATVQRIVNRHAGVIEARGELGKGAIFCFALSDTPTDSTHSEKET